MTKSTVTKNFTFQRVGMIRRTAAVLLVLHGVIHLIGSCRLGESPHSKALPIEPASSMAR